MTGPKFARPTRSTPAPGLGRRSRWVSAADLGPHPAPPRSGRGRISAKPLSVSVHPARNRGPTGVGRTSVLRVSNLRS